MVQNHFVLSRKKHIVSDRSWPKNSSINKTYPCTALHRSTQCASGLTYTWLCIHWLVEWRNLVRHGGVNKGNFQTWERDGEFLKHKCHVILQLPRFPRRYEHLLGVVLCRAKTVKCPSLSLDIYAVRASCVSHVIIKVTDRCLASWRRHCIALPATISSKLIRPTFKKGRLNVRGPFITGSMLISKFVSFYFDVNQWSWRTLAPHLPCLCAINAGHRVWLLGPTAFHASEIPPSCSRAAVGSCPTMLWRCSPAVGQEPLHVKEAGPEHWWLGRFQMMHSCAYTVAPDDPQSLMA